MLDIQVTIEGDKIVIQNLERYTIEIPRAIDRGLRRVGKGVDRAAMYFLTWQGAKSKKATGPRAPKEGERTGFTKKSGERVNFDLLQDAGHYPVPVRTGHLRRHLDWLTPGQTKSDDQGTYTAGPLETVIYDSAEYARVIHEGTGSSRKFGPRRYLSDALERFNSGDGIKAVFEEEIGKVINP